MLDKFRHFNQEKTNSVILLLYQLNWMMKGERKEMRIYHEIHRLHRLGINKSQIERKVGVNRDTVRKYLEKNFEELSEWTYTLQNRTKRLDPYAEIFLEWLKEHNDLSGAQIEDWLLEEYPDLQVGSSTVRSYIKHL